MKSPLNLKPKLWQRSVDVVLEIIKMSTTENLTEYLNIFEILFTYIRRGGQSKDSFLGHASSTKGRWFGKTSSEPKMTYTDQYLDFQSQHPLHHKLGDIRTLMDRMENTLTEGEETGQER